MRFGKRRLLSVSWLSAGALLLAAACESTVADNLEGMPCDAQGNCVTGYFCDAHRTCVRDELTGGSGGEAAEPAETQVCAAGHCAAECPSGQTLCSGVCVNLRTDPANCGVCANACKALPHGVPSCKSVCSVVCDVGFQLCGNECVDTSRDKKHCGSCANACGKDACIAGICSGEGEKGKDD
jgi:hypothetical protein